jgi:hypothetical protein
MVRRCGSASAGRFQPESARVARADGSAEIVLPGALAELPRGGLALFSPLAGGVNDGGFPELAGDLVPPAGGGVGDCGVPLPLSGDVDPVSPPPLATWPAAPPVPPPEETSGTPLLAAITLSPLFSAGEAIGDA